MSRKILTASEVRKEIFQNKISMAKLYQIIKQKDIPSIQVGGKYYFFEDSVQAWLDEKQNR